MLSLAMPLTPSPSAKRSMKRKGNEISLSQPPRRFAGEATKLTAFIAFNELAAQILPISQCVLLNFHHFPALRYDRIQIAV